MNSLVHSDAFKTQQAPARTTRDSLNTRQASIHLAEKTGVNNANDKKGCTSPSSRQGDQSSGALSTPAAAAHLTKARSLSLALC